MRYVFKVITSKLYYIFYFLDAFLAQFAAFVGVCRSGHTMAQDKDIHLTNVLSLDLFGLATVC